MSETGELPELLPGWEWKPLHEVARTSSGGTPRRSHPEYYENGTIPWLKIGDLNDSTVDTTEERITALGLEESSADLLPAGTLLLAIYGSIGKLGVLGMEAATNQAICAIHPDEEMVSRDYLFWFFLSQRSSLLNAGYGGTQANISQKFLRTLPIPVPPPSEQSAIVSRLTEMFVRVDELGRNLRALCSAEEALRRSILRQGVLGRLPD